MRQYIHLTKQYVDNGVGGASHALVYAGVSADGLNYSGHWTVPGRNEEGTFDITAPDSFLCRAQAVRISFISLETGVGGGYSRPGYV